MPIMSHTAGMLSVDKVEKEMNKHEEYYWEDSTKKFLQEIDYEDLITIVEVARIALEQESCIGNINLGYKLDLSDEELERIYKLVEIDCISKLEKTNNYFEYYIDDDGTVDNQLTLTSDAHISLTYALETLVEKYSGVEDSAFMKCSEIRDDVVDLIHTIINKKELRESA